MKADGEDAAAKAEGGEGEGGGEGGEGGEYAEDDEEDDDGDDDGADGDPDAGLDGEDEEDDDDDDDDDDEDCRPAQRKPHSRRAAPPADALAAAAAGARKPQSAYMLFVNARRAELMLEHPGIKMPEVGRRCGEMWRSMGLEQRAEYQVCLPFHPAPRHAPRPPASRAPARCGVPPARRVECVRYFTCIGEDWCGAVNTGWRKVCRLLAIGGGLRSARTGRLYVMSAIVCNRFGLCSNSICEDRR